MSTGEYTPVFWKEAKPWSYRQWCEENKRDSVPLMFLEVFEYRNQSDIKEWGKIKKS